MAILTVERLKELLHYDQATGIFTYAVFRGHFHVGSIAGGHTAKGYISIKIDNLCYRANRLAWLWMTGRWPQHEVDHKNGVRDDNSWKNLRDATDSINAQNQRKPQRNNRSGFLGVSIRRNKFRASIRVDGKKLRLGEFETPELAHEAYLTAKRSLHEGCTI